MTKSPGFQRMAVAELEREPISGLRVYSAVGPDGRPTPSTGPSCPPRWGRFFYRGGNFRRLSHGGRSTVLNRRGPQFGMLLSRLLRQGRLAPAHRTGGHLFLASANRAISSGSAIRARSLAFPFHNEAPFVLSSNRSCFSHSSRHSSCASHRLRASNTSVAVPPISIVKTEGKTEVISFHLQLRFGFQGNSQPHRWLRDGLRCSAKLFCDRLQRL
jgi:hypothetical protein